MHLLFDIFHQLRPLLVNDAVRDSEDFVEAVFAGECHVSKPLKPTINLDSLNTIPVIFYGVIKMSG